MGDRALTELAWKAFAKGRGLKDAPLAKALAELSKVERAGPDSVLKALDAVDAQVDELRGAKKSDKELQAYLDKIGKAAATLRSDTKKAAKEAEAEDEEDTPEVLTSKLIPLIRQLRKGDVVMPVLIATAGKDTAVMISRKAISPARGKVLKDYLGTGSGLKFIRGECLLEGNALTFVVQSQAAGLAKRVNFALFKQTDLRLKVRVRGETEDDVDEDDQEAEGAPGGTAETTSPKAPKGPDLKADFDARMAAVDGPLKQVLQKKSPGHAYIESLHKQARDKAVSGDLLGAITMLRNVQQRVDESLAAGVSPGAESGKAEDKDDTSTKGLSPSDAFKARLTKLLPGIKEASARDTATAQALKLQVSEAGALARQNRFDQAEAMLDRIEQALRPPTGVDPAAAFNARLTALLPRIKEVSAGRPDEDALLKVRVGVAAGKAKDRDYAGAQQVLDEIERMLADFTSETGGQGGARDDGGATARARAEQAREEIEAATGKGSVRFKALAEDWRRSLARVQSETARIALALSNHPLVVMDPRSGEIQDRAAEFESKLPKFDGSLERALAAAADARGPDELMPARRVVATAVDAYLKVLDTADPLVRALDDTFVGKAAIYSEMLRALNGLKQVLTEA